MRCAACRVLSAGCRVRSCSSWRALDLSGPAEAITGLLASQLYKVAHNNQTSRAGQAEFVRNVPIGTGRRDERGQQATTRTTVIQELELCHAYARFEGVGGRTHCAVSKHGMW